MLSLTDLWKLRQEIKLGSLFIVDYRNSFGAAPHKVCDFFDGFLEFVGRKRRKISRAATTRISGNCFPTMTPRNTCWTGIPALRKTRCR